MSDREKVQVVSEIHTFLESSVETKPLLKNSYRVAKLGFSLPKKHGGGATSSINCNNDVAAKISEVEKVGRKLLSDSDGDLMVERRKPENTDFLQETFMLIEYENSTTLDLVGLQVWRGAFLLADFIIEHAEKYFSDKKVVELGSGTGMTSIVAALYANKVIATDINQCDILGLIEANVKHNENFVKCDFQVKALDFLHLDWSLELENCISTADVIFAADVVYHVSITEGFARTLKKIVTVGKSKDIFIALEKRYVFTISDLDTAAPMYAHFLDELESVLGLSLPSDPNSPPYEICVPGTPIRLSMTSVPINFPQHFNYERTKELILLHIRSTTPQSPPP